MDQTRLRLRSTRGRLAVAASVLGSGMAFLDSTLVNVALAEIGDEFGVGFTEFQWVANGYLLTLSALLLLGGSFGDLWGRRRVFVYGVSGFGIASLAVGLAPNIEALIVARLVQGATAAMLAPASLAMLQGGFVSEDRPAAIGAWSGFSGLAIIMGPLVGGALIDALSWRWAFLINPALAGIAIVLARRHVPETLDDEAKSPDVMGGILAMIGLAGVTYSLIQGPATGWSGPVTAAGIGGAFAIAAFVAYEARSSHPMLPLGVFRSVQFSGANLVTLLVYFVLSGAFFLVILQMRGNMGYDAFTAGLATVPATGLVFLLSPRAGRLLPVLGPRRMMTVGPVVAGVGIGLLARVTPGGGYAEAVLPGMLVFGLGMGIVVAPLTATALAAVADRHAGLASAVNNTVARTAGLLAIPLLPLLARISGVEDVGPAFSSGFQRAMLIGALICAAGGAISWLMIEDDPPAP